MEHCFIIDGYDYIGYILQGGIDWGDNDLDSEDSGRTLDGVMHRTVVSRKRNLKVSLVPLTSEQFAQFSRAVRKPFVDITFLDPAEGGQITRTFYGSSIQARSMSDINGATYWRDGTIAFAMQ